MSVIKTDIQEAIKTAMRAQDKRRLAVLRLAAAAIKQKEVDERIELTDEHLLVLLDKMIKQRRESIEQFSKANRFDLVEQESFEIDVIQTFLPTPLTPAEINAILDAVIAETQASSIKDMGKIMAVLRPQLQGRADIAMVSQQIKDRFQ